MCRFEENSAWTGGGSNKFHVCGLRTPDKPICGGAYIVLFPMMNALLSGAKFNFEKNPYSKTKLACPDNGHIVFKVILLHENDEEYKWENKFTNLTEKQEMVK